VTAGKAQPQALLQGCFQPVLLSTPLNKHQAELLVQAVKQFSPALLPGVVTAACSATPATPQPSAASGPEWTEHTIALVQAAVDRKAQLQEEDLQRLLAGLQRAVAKNGSSLKLSKLLMAVMKAYGKEMDDGMKRQLRKSVEGVTTFMKKPLTVAYDKL
jgi:hypothetical protein